jgi:hypothetical protein
MRYFGGMTGRMLAPVAVMWMTASVAGPSALAAGLTGDEVTVLITERLTAENLQACTDNLSKSHISRLCWQG